MSEEKRRANETQKRLEALGVKFANRDHPVYRKGITVISANFRTIEHQKDNESDNDCSKDVCPDGDSRSDEQ